jgi:hypothetical protein
MYINVRELQSVIKKMDNPEKLEQNEENQNNNTTQYVLDTTMQNVENK